MKNHCVSAGADSASMNFGKVTGVMMRLASQLPWLIPVHCCAHKFELAIKDAFKNSYFTEVGDQILN